MQFSSPAVPPSPSNRSGTGGHVYTYSFDRETFRGRFETRDAARSAGEDALPKWPGPAEAIYVGRVIDHAPPLEGLAGPVLDVLRERAGEEAAAALNAASEKAGDDLDDRLARLVRAWLQKHDVFGESRVEEISEHPLPLIAKAPEKDNPEIGILGFD